MFFNPKVNNNITRNENASFIIFPVTAKDLKQRGEGLKKA
jgi:hypothetical protein